MTKPLIQKQIYDCDNSFNYALFSDLHIDAKDHDRPLLQRDLKDAEKNDARIFINGDTFDFILPGDRKRYNRSKDTYNADDEIVERIMTAVEVLKPYANRIDMIGMGNHETAVLKIHHIDTIRLLIWELAKHRDPSLPSIHHGGYTGFIKEQFEHKHGGHRKSYTIWYHHGTGGASPVTKGMIDFNRAMIHADADLYWMGHKHTSITDDGIKQLRMTDHGVVFAKEKQAIFTGGYKLPFMPEEDYMISGYKIDYSEEQHIGIQSSGYKLLTIDFPEYNGQPRARIHKR